MKRVKWLIQMLMSLSLLIGWQRTGWSIDDVIMGTDSEQELNMAGEDLTTDPRTIVDRVLGRRKEDPLVDEHAPPPSDDQNTDRPVFVEQDQTWVYNNNTPIRTVEELDKTPNPLYGAGQAAGATAGQGNMNQIIGNAGNTLLIGGTASITDSFQKAGEARRAAVQQDYNLTAAKRNRNLLEHYDAEEERLKKEQEKAFNRAREALARNQYATAIREQSKSEFYNDEAKKADDYADSEAQKIREQEAKATELGKQKGSLRAASLWRGIAGAGMLGFGAYNLYMQQKLGKDDDPGDNSDEGPKDPGGPPPILPPPPGDEGFPDGNNSNTPGKGNVGKRPGEEQLLGGPGDGGGGSGGGSSGGGGGGPSLGGGDGGGGDGRETASAGDKTGLEEKNEDGKPVESTLGDYGAGGGGDMAGLEMPDLSGLGMDGAGGLDSNGIDDLLASLFPQGDEENALFGPNLDPNQIIQQADASIFARIKKTYETFYPEWKKVTDKIKPKGQKENVASL